MPVSITKSAVSEETIRKMVWNAFGKRAEKILELADGCFNAAYQIDFDGRSVVLKVAPPKEVEVVTYEKISWLVK